MHTDGASTRVTDGVGVVSVNEMNSVDISCTSAGVPVPTISWRFNGQVATLNLTNSFMDHSVEVLNGGEFVLTEGYEVSTVHVVNARYPADDGVYVCTGSNSHGDSVMVSNAVITLRVLGLFKCGV